MFKEWLPRHWLKWFHQLWSEISRPQQRMVIFQGDFCLLLFITREQMYRGPLEIKHGCTQSLAISVVRLSECLMRILSFGAQKKKKRIPSATQSRWRGVMGDVKGSLEDGHHSQRIFLSDGSSWDGPSTTPLALPLLFPDCHVLIQGVVRGILYCS